MSRYFIFFWLISSLCFSQSAKDSLALFHNGKTASRFQFKTSDTILRLDYFKNGRLKDSVWLHMEVMVGYKNSSDSIVIRNYNPSGTEKKYYRNGSLSAIIVHGTDSSMTHNFHFRKDGSCDTYKETPYGLEIHYTKKGKVSKYADFNKKSYVIVPKKFRQGDHLKGSRFEARIKALNAVFVSGSRSLRLKAGAMTAMRTTNDTTLQRHCLIEGFSGDSVCVSLFDYDLSPSKNKLKYLGTKMIALSEIKSIFYSKAKPRTAYRTAAITEFIGFNMVLDPLAIVPVFVGAANLANPFVLGTMVVGIPVFICSKLLFRKAAPKEYKFSEWKLKS